MYVVAGASSQTGQRVVDGLLARDRPVRVLVRGDADAARFAERGATVARADVRDPAAVARACEGATVVVSLVGRHFARTEQGLWDVDAAGNENLVRAAVAAGAARFVLLSALWSDRDLPPVLFRAKRHAEQVLRASGLAHTILRPSTFVVGPSSLIGLAGPTVERWGVCAVPAPDSGPVSFVVERDVADGLLVAALEDSPPGTSRVVEFGGPEALTFAQGAERVARALGKRAHIVRVPRRLIAALRPSARRRGFGAYEALLFLEMIADHGYACDPAPARQLLGRELTSVDEALREYYAGGRRTAWRDSNFGTLRVRAD